MALLLLGGLGVSTLALRRQMRSGAKNRGKPTTGAAYDALSPRFKTFLEGLTAYHDGGPFYRETNAKLGRPETGKIYPNAVHPLVRIHPVTNRKTLFANRGFTIRINELPADESRAVLDFLFEHSTKPDYQVRFSWQPYSVAFWDIRSK